MNTIKKVKKFSSSDEFCVLMGSSILSSDYYYELRMLVKKLANIFLRKLANQNVSLILSDKREAEKLKYNIADMEELSPLDVYFWNNLGELKIKLYQAIKEEIENISLKVNAGLFELVNEEVFQELNRDKLGVLERKREIKKISNR